MDKNDLLDEHFVPVEGLPNYAVSNYGRVINVKKGNELKATPDPKGYYRVALYHNAKRFEYGVHRLVAQAFFADFHPDIEVRHINDDQSDNAIMNLTLGARLKVRVRIVELDKAFDSLTACAEYIGKQATDICRVFREQNGKGLGYTFELVDGKA